MDIPRKDRLNQALYYEPYGTRDFSKVAQEATLPNQVAQWPAVILNEFASQHPYAFQASAPEIEFEKVDERRGSAFGAIILRKPYQVTGLGSPPERLEQEPEKVAVPIIIDNFKLKPFEIFIRGEKVMPLTQGRFAEMGAGSPVAAGLDPYFQPSPLFLDKMIPPTVGYLGNLYGNYSLSGGEGNYSNWTPAKGAAEAFEPKLEKSAGSADPAKERTFLSQVRSTITNNDWDSWRSCVGDERAMAGFALNKTLPIIREIMGSSGTSYDDYLDFVERSAPVHLVCLKKQSNGRWKAVTTSDYFYKPVSRELKAAEVVERFSALKPGLAGLMASTDEILIEAPERRHMRPYLLEDHTVVAEDVKADGHYVAVAKDGGFLEGQVVCRVLDYSGNAAGAKLFIGSGCHAFQEELVGERLGEADPHLKGGSLETGAEGTFLGSDEAGQFALLPFKVTNVGRVVNYIVAQAVGPIGEKLTFVLMPGVTRFVNATGIADPALGDKIAGNVYYIPPSFHFVPLGKKVRIVDDPREVNDLVKRKSFFSERHMEPFSVETTRRGHGRTMRVISVGNGDFTLKGSILESLGYDDQAQDLSPTEAQWILSALGLSLEDAVRVTAMAIDKGECNVSNLRPAKPIVKKEQVFDRNLAELAASFRRNLFKEASTMGDPKAVDAMLSLNFVNESNLMEFMNNLPLFREVEEKLAELYLYCALGLKNQVPEQAALSAMKSLNEVTEHLEYLASMLRTEGARSQPQGAVA